MLFPKFKLKSVTFIFACLILLVFIITEIVYAVKKNSDSPMSWQCVLYWSGGKFTYAISRKGHIHRLFLPMILHSGFFHIFWNVLTLLMIGFVVEEACGRWFKYVILLIAGAIGGTIFSAVVDPYSIGVGASSSLFALLAVMCIWFYLNYNNLGP